jgi:hypothetical protein
VAPDKTPQRGGAIVTLAEIAIVQSFDKMDDLFKRRRIFDDPRYRRE